MTLCVPRILWAVVFRFTVFLELVHSHSGVVIGFMTGVWILGLGFEFGYACLC